MSDLARLLARQLLDEARALPRRGARRLGGRPDVAACATTDEIRAAARRALPKVIFDFVDGAAGDEWTARRNIADLQALEIAPRILVDVSVVDTGTTALGTPIALPVIGAPTGLTGLVHHEGEVGLATGAHRAGSIYTLAAMSSYSIEEVAAASPGPTWFQTYVWRDRGLVAELLGRARAAGMTAAVFTVDVPVAAARDRDRRNGFGLPPRATFRSVASGLRRPAWSWAFLRDPRITAANVAADPHAAGEAISVAGYINEQFDPRADWSALEWLRGVWDGPLVVKGLTRAEDARQAVALGADAVVVSNHGGRQLDHAPTTIRALPAVADAVGADAEVFLDGGIRRGTDVLKAVALGARAVLVGRPLVFGLGAGGAAGVERAMTILGDELRTAMTLAGVARIADLDPSLIVARPAADDPSHPSTTTGRRHPGG